MRFNTTSVVASVGKANVAVRIGPSDTCVPPIITWVVAVLGLAGSAGPVTCRLASHREPDTVREGGAHAMPGVTVRKLKRITASPAVSWRSQRRLCRAESGDGRDVEARRASDCRRAGTREDRHAADVVVATPSKPSSAASGGSACVVNVKAPSPVAAFPAKSATALVTRLYWVG